MQSQIFDFAAVWVCQQANFSMLSKTGAGAISQALCALHGLARTCGAAIMVPDLFPGCALETVFLPAASVERVTTTVRPQLLGETEPTISTAALSVIGSAVSNALERSGNDMVRYEFDDGSEAIAFKPNVRETVLLATGLVLLND